jgi:dipeptidyl aminopeptidase/acylaminoacyl peptidase
MTTHSYRMRPPNRLVLWCAIAALAFGRVALAQQAVTEASPPRLLTQTNCFGALYESYSSWMEFLRSKNNLLAYSAIRLRFRESEFELYKRTLDCRAITYLSDGNVVRGWLVQPRKRASGVRHPVIVYNRGGNRAFGVVTFAHLFTHVFPLAESGFVVVVSQYRGAVPQPGEAHSPDEFGGADVHDVTNLLRLAVRLPQADAANIYMIGHGRGSIMTFRSLLDAPIPVRAVAIYSGVYDLHDLIVFRPEFDGLFRELIPGYVQSARDERNKRSVNRWASQLPAGAGVLVIHGESDDAAPVGSARTFVSLAAKLDITHKAIFYPGETNYLDGKIDDVHAETLAWFRKFRRLPVPAPRFTTRTTK